MSITPYLLKATGRFDSTAETIEKVVNKSIKDIIKVLPVKDVDIILYDNPEGTIEHIGIGGYTPNANLVYISFDPSVDNFSDKIHNHLGRQIAHELHHAIRWHKPGYGTTLLEALVTEGLGDAFSYEVFPGEIEKWDNALTGDELITLRETVEKDFNSAYNHGEWFFGMYSEIPRWTGYTLGFAIVKDYLEKHGKTAASSYRIEAKEFI